MITGQFDRYIKSLKLRTAVIEGTDCILLEGGKSISYTDFISHIRTDAANYKSVGFFISQSGTGDPSIDATAYNDLDEGIELIRYSDGVYHAIAVGKYIEWKTSEIYTFCFLEDGYSMYVLRGRRLTDDIYELCTYVIGSDKVAAGDSLLNKTYLEIKVYN